MQHYWHRFDRRAELALLAATTSGRPSDVASIVYVENASSRYELTGMHREGGVWKATRRRAEGASDAMVISVERMIDAQFSTSNEPGVYVTRNATKAEVEWGAKLR